MGIEKGRDWGSPGRLDDDAPVFGADHDLAAHLADGRAGSVGLLAGDLARTLGLPTRHDPRSAGFLVPVDAMRVWLDGGAAHLAVAHVVLGDLLWLRDPVAVMNAAFIGRLNVAPRAHPGDGLVDVVEFDLGPADRLKARRRMPLGMHVPHPGIRTRRGGETVHHYDRPRVVRLDGRRVGRAREVRVEVVPDAVRVAV